MLVESRKIRDLLHTSLLMKTSGASRMCEVQEPWHPPKTYGVSLNPLPALVILLLGFMMSSHHQDSMVSTMMHKQWGTLLVGFSLARAVTYVMSYISPPTSLLPSRPPSEIISAFCLMSGGLIFMASVGHCSLIWRSPLLTSATEQRYSRCHGGLRYEYDACIYHGSGLHCFPYGMGNTGLCDQRLGCSTETHAVTSRIFGCLGVLIGFYHRTFSAIDPHWQWHLGHPVDVCSHHLVRCI